MWSQKWVMLGLEKLTIGVLFACCDAVGREACIELTQIAIIDIVASFAHISSGECAAIRAYRVANASGLFSGTLSP
jgi:hypothetical protein